MTTYPARPRSSGFAARSAAVPPHPAPIRRRWRWWKWTKSSSATCQAAPRRSGSGRSAISRSRRPPAQPGRARNIMPILLLDRDGIADLASGAAFLGSGGGGDPYHGRLLGDAELSRGGTIALIPLAEL